MTKKTKSTLFLASVLIASQSVSAHEIVKDANYQLDNKVTSLKPLSGNKCNARADAVSEDCLAPEGSKLIVQSIDGNNATIQFSKVESIKVKNSNNPSDDEKDKLQKHVAEGNIYTIGKDALVVKAVNDQKNKRDRFHADVYFGGAYDNFSGPVEKYINYEEDEASWRNTFGVVFEYGAVSTVKHSLWVTGKTLRGVRNAEVDCTGEDANKPSVCTDLTKFPANARDRARYLLRNASSFEGSIGLRYEYHLNHWFDNLTTSSFPGSSLFLKYELGGAAVDDDDDDIAKIDSFSAGVIITDGSYRGSFFQIGKGKNEIFTDDPSGRLKIKVRAVLSDIGFWGLTGNKKPFGFFVQLNVDADNSDGADSIQTYAGFTASLDTITNW